MNTISYILIAIGFIGLWHFVYEAILLPSMRQNLRFQVFALRDRLRTLKAEHPKQCEDAPFHMLDQSLSWQMNNLHKVTLLFLLETAKRKEHDKDFAEHVKKRIALAESCKLPEFVELLKLRQKLYEDTLALNSGGMFVYLVPVVIAAITWQKIRRYAKVWTGMSDHELERMAPAFA
jgi:hypothetical protein